MSGIKGNKREVIERTMKVGLLQGNVIAINPTLKEKEEILGYTIGDDAEETDYTGMSKDGNPYVRIEVHQQKPDTGEMVRINFFLEDKIRMNKDETKTQYINNIGVCSWAEDEEQLPSWFVGRAYREAYNGEEEFYGFLRTWLGALNLRDEDAELQVTWKKLMKGDVSELKEQIGGEFAVEFVSLVTVKSESKENEDTGEEELVQYQNVYNKAFLPAYAMKHFRVKNYDDELVQAAIAAKEFKDMKLHERFVLNVTGEYGCKVFYKLQPLDTYDQSEDPYATLDTIIEEEAQDISPEY